MYGCTQQKNGAASAKLRDMEARYAKLEEDYRVVAATSAAQRKKLNQAEAEKTELAREADELRPAAPASRDEAGQGSATSWRSSWSRAPASATPCSLSSRNSDRTCKISSVASMLPSTRPACSGSPVTAVPASHKAE